MLKEFLTTKELSEMFKVTPQTIWRWTKEGLPSIKIQHSRRFKREEVEEWILKNGK